MADPRFWVLDALYLSSAVKNSLCRTELYWYRRIPYLPGWARRRKNSRGWEDCPIRLKIKKHQKTLNSRVTTRWQSQKRYDGSGYGIHWIVRVLLNE